MKRALLAFALFAGAACNSPTDVGSPCSVTTDCDGAHFCDTSSPGGFCTRGCTFEGALDECPGGSICTYTGGTVQVCAPYCTTDADCRNLYGCYDVKGSTKKACGPKR
jgi:hypothetical protein